MPIAKRLRFEIFKRDNFTCQYCGRQTPTVTLEVDHITPRAEGGTDDPNNLVSACMDCNRGKGAIPLSIQKLKDSRKEEMERAQEKREQLAAYEEFLREQRNEEEERIDWLCNHWSALSDEKYELTDHAKLSLRRFLKSLSIGEIEDAINIAAAKIPVEKIDVRFKYFCGICHNRIGEKNGDTSRQDYRDVERHYLNKRKTAYLKEDRLKELVRKYPKETLKQAIDRGFGNYGAYDVGSYWKAFICALEEITGEQIDY